MKKEVKIGIIVALALVLVIAVYYASRSGSLKPGGSAKPAGVPDKMLENQTPEAAEATQSLINEVVKDAAVQTITQAPLTTDVNGEATPAKEIKVAVVSPGTSGINVESGEVVTERGVAVNNAATPGAQDAPQSSFPITPESAPSSAIKLEVTSSSFSPNTFTVNRGQVVSLVVSNVNETTFTEILRFDDPSLGAVVVGVAKGTTKSITFNAPDKAGEYTFYSSMFNHRDLGAVGKMIVK